MSETKTTPSSRREFLKNTGRITWIAWKALLTLAAAGIAAASVQTFLRFSSLSRESLAELESGARSLELRLPPGASVALSSAYILEAIGSGLAAAVILALAWRSVQRPEARALAFLLGFWFFKPEVGAPLGIPSGEPDTSYVLVNFAIAALLRFSALFPRPLTREDLFIHAGQPQTGFAIRWRLVRISLASLLLRSSLPWIAAAIASAALLLSSQFNWRGVGQAACWAFVVVGAMQSLGFIRTGYANSDPVARRKILWLFQALNTVVSGILLLVLVGFPLFIVAAKFGGFELGAYFYPAGSLLGILVVIFLMLAIFRDGGLDPALVIRRTLIYTGVTVLLVFFLGALETLVSRLLVQEITNPFTQLMVGGILTIAFGPVRDWSRRRVDRYLKDRLPATALAEEAPSSATVVFCDLVGYTRLSSENEKAGLTLLSVFHKAGQRAVNKHRGRLIKTIGDALLMTFRDPVQALQTTFEIRSIAPQAAEALELPTPSFTTGIHHGPVTKGADGDIFGAAVNLASRLQTSAAAGEIIVSRTVADAPDVKARFTVEPLGAAVLKNIPEPVERFRVSGRSVAAPRIFSKSAGVN